MPMVEDLTVFFDDAEFAHQAVIENRVVRGILRAPGVEAFDSIAARDVVFVLPEAEARQAQQGVGVRIVGGDSYRIRSALPDGTGLVRLTLERA